MTRLDPHSYADDTQPSADFLQWTASVDFASRTLSCEATLHLREPAAEPGPLDLDTRDLTIGSVSDDGGNALRFDLAGPDPILGQRLRVQLPAGTTQVKISYRTAPESTALQWLEPAQTSTGKPFLYTQCQAIHARSVVPLQDTPRTRLRFEAELTAPADLTVLMAAEAIDAITPGTSRFRMDQPIAPYLFAFAVGELASRDIGPRSRVWAEPQTVDQAAWEFAETEAMLQVGERLFGPYDWQRYDMLVLPPSFPYGGMENPRLTFLSPTVIARDRSLVAVVAHELAHSWSGNLISNANAEHFWLNEGWTTYAERRIVEALWGPDIVALHWALGQRKLAEDMQRVERELGPELTALRNDMHGVHPDELISLVPYDKGALFLRSLEEAAGRERFDAFIHAYIGQYRFGVLTSEEFLGFAEQHLGSAVLEQVDAPAWLYQPGLPATAPRIESQRLAAIDALGSALPPHELAQQWTAIEWQLYLDGIATPASREILRTLDDRYQLTQTDNYDILESWLALSIRSDYGAATARLEQALCEVGRLRFLRVLYGALLEQPETRELARTIFQRCAGGYHPATRSVIGNLLQSASR